MHASPIAFGWVLAAAGLAAAAGGSGASAAPSSGLKVMPALSLYTSEPEAEIAVDAPPEALVGKPVAEVSGPGLPLVHVGVRGPRTIVPVSLAAVSDGVHEVRCRLLDGDRVVAEAATTLRKAPPKPNEVKIDNIAKGLIAGGLPFVPVGFYCYYPLAPGIIDREVSNGFSLLSPYHYGPHSAEDLGPIRAYMDRCAQVGMRVNYHLMWSTHRSEDLSGERERQLREEIAQFRGHPALLSWYIADEPIGNRLPPERLERVYGILKEMDPYHPVTVVFYEDPKDVARYAGALDIVMGDPYPIPNRPVTMVSDMADNFRRAFGYEKPLWIVPQAFGGNEWWGREPTPQEQRVMGYLSLIHGAMGLQYFVRDPASNFPKSPIMWAECARVALEASELAPALLSREPRPTVRSAEETIHVAAWRDRGLVVILAANTENRPRMMRLELAEPSYWGSADVLFENRAIKVVRGVIEEPIDAYGTRAYSLPVGPIADDDVDVASGNLTVDPSFEQCASTGIPSAVYASSRPGATHFVDSRVARHGRHSLRLIAPTDSEPARVSPFPVSLKAGVRYRASLWAKAAGDGAKLELDFGDLGRAEFAAGREWAEYTLTLEPKGDVRTGPRIALAAAGTVWVDLYQVVPQS